MKWKSKIFLFISIVFCYQVFANNPEFRYLKMNARLSQNTVLDIMVDKYGFIWFATEDGLNRYDGYRVKTFDFNPENPEGISDNYVISLLEDSRGNIWAGTAKGGLNLFDRKTEIFEHFKHEKDDPESISDNAVVSLLEDSRGRFWVGTAYGGLNLFDRNKKSFRRIKWGTEKNIPLERHRIWSIKEIDGQIWIGTAAGLKVYSEKKDQMVSNNFESRDGRMLNSSGIRAVHDDGKGYTWFGTARKGLFRLDQKEGTFERFANIPGDDSSISINSITRIFSDSKKNLWIGTEAGGLNRYDYLTGKFERYNDSNIENGFNPHDRIFAFCEDSSGIMWVGLFGDVPKKLNLYYKKFHTIEFGDKYSSGLKGSNVWAILKDSRKNLWIGTSWGGLNRLDYQQDSFVNYDFQTKYSPNLPNTVISLFEDKGGTVWVGTATFGLFKYLEKSDNFKRYRYFPGLENSPGSNKIWDIYQSRDGLIWLGTDGAGLVRFDPVKETFTIFNHDEDDPYSISNDLVWEIVEDSTGNLWVATESGGLNYLNRDNGRFISFTHDPSDSFSIGSNRIFSVYIDEYGNVWTGTSGSGINFLKKGTKKFQRYDRKRGFADNVIYSIQPDNNNQLWVSTNEGISRFNIITGEIKNYFEIDGLSSSEFNATASYKDKDGIIYFGGINGVTWFDPESIRDNEFIGNIVFTDLRIFNRSVIIGKEYDGRIILPYSINEMDKLTLSHKDFIITFEFSLLNNAFPEDYKYKYRLKGFEENWNIVNYERRYATYTNLPAGNYKLQVMAANHDGIWTPHLKELEIIVTPPFWDTLLFKILFSLIIISLVSGVIYLRMRTVKNREIELESLVRLRTGELEEANRKLGAIIVERKAAEEELIKSNRDKDRMFSIIAHDLKNPFAALLSSTSLLATEADLNKEEKTELKTSIYNSTKNLYYLLENLLNWALIQSGRIESRAEKLYLHDSILRTFGIFKGAAKNKKISLSLVEENDLVISADSQMVDVILRNLLSNAIKFTPVGSEVVVKVRRKDDFAEINVIDKGIGMDSDQINNLFSEDNRESRSGTFNEKGTGLGLIICKEFVQKNKGEIKVKSKPGAGSVFSFTLPLHNQISE